MIYQYIFAPWASRSWVVIHDILPITHPKLFETKFRIRSAVLFAASILFSRRIVVVSEYTRSEILKKFPSYKGEIVVVPNGPSFDEDVYFGSQSKRLLQAIVSEGQRYILAVGRLEKRKNIDLLIKSFKKSQIHGVNLVIVGSPETTHDNIGSEDGIVWAQNVSDATLAALYSNADLFVYPSEAEGFGIPLLDAILFGVPTISSSTTAMPEVGSDLVEYFDPTDAHAVSKLSERIVAHFSGSPVTTPSLEQRKAQAAKFSWSRAADILAAALRHSSS